MGRKAICRVCNNNIITDNDIKECPKCGSNEITYMLSFSDKVEMHDNIKGKAKIQGKKKPIKEFNVGDEYSKSREKYVDKTRIIDRENDLYVEVVKDKETGEMIHECKEPLSEHFGHGSAKFKNNN